MARRPSVRDRAVITRTYDFGEADRVVVLLTRSRGVVRAVAKGVRRAKSRFGSRLQYFVDLDVNFYLGRNLATITDADTVTYFGSGIIEDFERYSAACAVIELAEKLAYVTDEPEVLFDAVLDALGAMQRTEHPTLVLDQFALREAGAAGWQPQLFDCAQCSVPGPHHAFHPEVGGAVCWRCRPSGSAEVEEESLHVMWLLEHGRMEQARGVVKHSPYVEAEAHRLTMAYVQWHVESRLASVKVMEQR